MDVFPEARRCSVTVRTRGRLTPQTSRACESGHSSDRRRDEHIGGDAPTSEAPGSMPVPFSQKTYIPVRTNEQSYSYAVIVAMWRWVLVSGANGTGPPHRWRGVCLRRTRCPRSKPPRTQWWIPPCGVTWGYRPRPAGRLCTNSPPELVSVPVEAFRAMSTVVLSKRGHGGLAEAHAPRKLR